MEFVQRTMISAKVQDVLAKVDLGRTEPFSGHKQKCPSEPGTSLMSIEDSPSVGHGSSGPHRPVLWMAQHREERDHRENS